LESVQKIFPTHGFELRSVRKNFPAEIAVQELARGIRFWCGNAEINKIARYESVSQMWPFVKILAVGAT
jgi:hypothetical protein